MSGDIIKFKKKNKKTVKLLFLKAGVLLIEQFFQSTVGLD